MVKKKYMAVKLTEHGLLTDERNEPIICPIRKSCCTVMCAWFSIEDRVFRCKDTIIGASSPGAMRSFRLHKGPDVYQGVSSEKSEPYHSIDSEVIIET